MAKLQYKIEINAPRKKVHEVMLADKTYREWTQPFNPSGDQPGASYFKGDWKKGSKILFIGPDPETGKEMGMVSHIEENKPGEFVSIKHLGIYKDGVEDTESDEAKKWGGAFENYTFKDKNGGTELIVDLTGNLPADFTDFMAEAWPKALNILKEIAER